MSSPHPSLDTLRRYLHGTLAGNESLAVARHVMECAECRTTATIDLDLSARIDGVIGDVMLGDSERLHLTSDQLEKALDGREDEVEKIVRESHLEGCQLCTRELAQLRIFAGEVSARAKRRRSRRLLPIAATLLLGISSLIVFRRSEPIQPQPPQPSPIAVRPVEKPLVVLLDGGGPITRSPRTGKLAGLTQASLDDISPLVDGGSITKPRVLEEIDSRQLEVVRGEPGKSQSQLTTPVGIVVQSNRPRFSWDPRPGDSHYEVSVYDASLRMVSSSGLIREETWTPPAALPRGQTYLWELTVHRGIEVSRQPRPPLAPARFHVLSKEATQRLDRVADTRSHLLLAVACAEEGLIECAQKELNALQRLNPQNPLPRRLEEEIARW